jgi:uncharacterized membrane protein YeiB
MAISERALGPDLARGLMLWFIALANAHYFLWTDSSLGGYPYEVGALDRVTTWVLTTFVDARAYPLFALLFGYGVAQVVRRHVELGLKRARRVLWRRAGVLVVVGLVHGIVLYSGDVLAGYGVLLAVGAWAVFWRDRWLLGWAGVLFLLIASAALLPAVDPKDGPYLADLPTDPREAIVERLSMLPLALLAGPFIAACPFLVGLWAGRRRLLERPSRKLAIVAVVGIAVGVLGAQPLAFIQAEIRAYPGDGAYGFAEGVDIGTGVIGGLGYAAAFAWLAPRLRRGRGVRALVATGQRSMTCYLAQSVVWAVVFTPFLLGLADDLSVTVTALLATATWAGTVALAAWMQRTGRRGPFETLLRSATYGRPRPAEHGASGVAEPASVT